MQALALPRDEHAPASEEEPERLGDSIPAQHIVRRRVGTHEMDIAKRGSADNDLEAVDVGDGELAAVANLLPQLLDEHPCLLLDRLEVRRLRVPDAGPRGERCAMRDRVTPERHGERHWKRRAQRKQRLERARFLDRPVPVACAVLWDVDEMTVTRRSGTHEVGDESELLRGELRACRRRVQEALQQAPRCGRSARIAVRIREWCRRDGELLPLSAAARDRTPVIDEDDVAARDAHSPPQLTVDSDGRQAEREPQRVLSRPLNVEHGLVLNLVDSRDDARQPHRLAMRRIRVVSGAGAGAEDLFEDQDVSLPQRQRPLALWVFAVAAVVVVALADPLVLERCGRRTRGDAAFVLAPRPELDLVVRRSQGQGLRRHGLEHLVRRRRHVVEVVRPQRHACVAGRRRRRDEVIRARLQLELGADGDDNPGARVAALVHAVVDEPRVPAHRDAPPRGVEVGLGADGVLVVAQVVADVGEQLDERRCRGRRTWRSRQSGMISASRSSISCRKLA